MLHYLILVPVLYIFWLLLSGQNNLFFFALGAVSVALVVWFQIRMDRTDREPALIRLSTGILYYAAWLLKEVLKSNVDVVKRIWNPELPIQPVWQKLDIQVKTAWEKTLYANSITLTPGTLTTDVKDDHFMIHTLTPEAMQELQQGEMERRIKKLGI